MIFPNFQTGKSSILCRYLLHEYLKAEYEPTIEDSYRGRVTCDDIQRPVEILDTSGSEDCRALKDNWIRHGESYLIVFSWLFFFLLLSADITCIFLFEGGMLSS